MSKSHYALMTCVLLLAGLLVMRGLSQIMEVKPESPSLSTGDQAGPTIHVDGIDTPKVEGVVIAPSGGYELVHIPGGIFLMGSPMTEEGRWHYEGPQIEVVVETFYLGRYEVSNAEYAQFLEAKPQVNEPRYWQDSDFNDPTQPVVGLTWDEANLYCAWAGLRLPSEAEWEYACRAGSRSARHGDVDDIAWTARTSSGHPHPVGLKQPNAWGLHDMLGNAWEWCENNWHKNYEDYSLVDGAGDSSECVIRGGCWFSHSDSCRAASRSARYPSGRDRRVGFRAALSAR